MEITKMKMNVLKYNLKVADISTAATTNTWTIKNEFGGNYNSAYTLAVHGRIVTQFVGITGPVWMEIGTADVTDCIMPRINVMAAKVNQLLFSHMPMSRPAVICQMLPLYTYSQPAPIVTFTSDSGNLEDLTAGHIEIVVIGLI